MYPKKRNRLRVFALLLSFVLALCVLTGAAIAEEPFPGTPEDPTTETAEQPPAEETPEQEPGGEDVPPSEPEEPELPEEPPMEGAYALDADVPGGWQNRPATIYVRVIDLNGTDLNGGDLTVAFGKQTAADGTLVRAGALAEDELLTVTLRQDRALRIRRNDPWL